MFGASSSGLEALIHRPRPSAWQLFWRNPSIFLVKALYEWHSRRIPTQAATGCDAVSVVCISDTHNAQCAIPEGDILIHAGDLTQSGTLEEAQATLSWIQAQPHASKIVVAGNHDLVLDKSYGVSMTQPVQDTTAAELLDWGDITYLQDSSTIVTTSNGRQLRVFGSPKSPRHGNWAFQYPRHQDVWTDLVPDNTDILITHSPPYAHLDLGKYGCGFLLRELWRVHPALHVFGHIHEGYGRQLAPFDSVQDAYERTLRAGGGVQNLLTVCYAMISNPRPQRATQLVNASIVGGLRDDKRRRPIKVYI